MRRFLAWITSIRLAIALIAYLAVTCVIATMVPQGLSDAEYASLYPGIVAGFIVRSGFGRFFGSAAFVVPAFLFLANLSACAVKRLVREIGKKRGRRHGPDILHLGLVLLVLGGVWSSSSRQQGLVTLAPGDGVNLPDGSILYLDDFRFERYADGRPRDWVSVVSIVKDGSPIRPGVEIRVNDPLRYAGLSYYQASYEERSTGPGSGYASVIQAVSDPGYPLVLVALAFVALGTTWTFAQKLREGV